MMIDDQLIWSKKTQIQINLYATNLKNIGQIINLRASKRDLAIGQNNMVSMILWVENIFL